MIVPNKTVFTFGELEAIQIATKIGILPMSTNSDPRKGVDYILALADRIKNERVSMAMELANK